MMKQTMQTPPLDNLAAILDGWFAVLRAQRAAGNEHAATWEALIRAEPTTGRRLMQFSNLRLWLLGLSVEVEGLDTPPPGVEDAQAQALHRQLFGSH
jgi:hypothetical protein